MLVNRVLVQIYLIHHYDAADIGQSGERCTAQIEVTQYRQGQVQQSGFAAGKLEDVRNHLSCV